MTKILTLVLLALSLAACGGEPFDASSEALAGAGGDAPEAGSVGVAVGGSAAQTGGSMSAAGKPAGGSAPQGGRPSTGGSASAGAGTAGAPLGGTGGSGSAGSTTGGTGTVTCDFDVTQLTAALPTTITWQDFTYTEGALCVTCRDKPCGVLHVISWGVPQVLEDGRYQYLPNIERSNLSMNIGTNDGMCTKQTECGINVSLVQLLVTVAQSAGAWGITKAEPDVSATSNMCTTSAGFGNTNPASASLQSELAKSLTGLKIPCK